jgi:CheY-like chemotaxis protein/two-component sensor histidine kinase
MLAHELRNPLAPIRNALSLVQIEGLDIDRAGWAMDMIQRQVDHMVRLVDDLLDVSRATQGKIKLRTARVELAKVVAHGIETARPLIDQQQHRLSVTLPQEPIWLEGDEIRLAQIVANLLNNASKYTDHGGSISLSAVRLDQQIVLRIRDTGIGIAPDVLPRIFDLFTQADGSLDRAHGGLGIGLCLVQKLVNLHGGVVQAHSDGPGKGSEFVVKLPIAAPPPEPPSEPGEFEATPSYRILIVDDNVDAATTLSMMFEFWKHEVRVVHDGQAALDMADSYQPDLVLLDIGLPGKNGYEVAQELRHRPAFEQTLLVAITGYGQADDRRASEDAGFDRHLVKPVEIRFLHELLMHPKLGREASRVG